jgi:hypothetical protein
LTRTYLLTTITSLIVSIFALAFPLTLVHSADPNLSTPRDTIHSFTCRYYRNAMSFNRDSASMGIPIFQTVSYPVGFKRMCVETEVGVGLMAGVLGLCVLGIGAGIWGWRSEKGIEKGRRERWEGKWRGVGITMGEEKA